MKFAAFTDVHLHKFPYANILSDGKNELFVAGLDILDQVYKYCWDNDITNLFFLGDLFYHRNKIDTDVYCNETYNRFKKHQEYNDKLQLIMMPGNHDQITKSGRHCLAPFEGIKNIRVIHKNTVIDDFSNNYKIFCCPYVDDLFFLYKFLKEATKDDVVLLHQLILNSPALSGQLFKAGDAVDLDKFSFKALFCGHNHRPFAKLDMGVYNIGAPMHHNYGDAQVLERFFVEYNDEENKVKWIPTKFPIFSVTDDMTASGEKPTYVRQAIKEMNEIADPVDSRLELTEEDGTDNILSAYIKYKQIELDYDSLLNTGLELLGEV